jgi:hypothetical protein
VLKQSVLFNLWRTYDITPVTMNDVLVGVVDVPAELLYDVASGAHFFLETV